MRSGFWYCQQLDFTSSFSPLAAFLDKIFYSEIENHACNNEYNTILDILNDGYSMVDLIAKEIAR